MRGEQSAQEKTLVEFSGGPGQIDRQVGVWGRWSKVVKNMDSVAVLELFRRSEALLEGHFELSSGLHSAGYLQCARVLQYPDMAQKLGQALAAKAARLDPTVVLSPALGGVVLGHEVARSLGVRALFAERRDGRLALRRGFQVSSDDRVLVVEDVVTTGLSTRETIQVATAAGSTAIGATALIDRGEPQAEFVLPFEALVRFPLPTHQPAACPMCACGERVIKPGSRSPGQ